MSVKKTAAVTLLGVLAVTMVAGTWALFTERVEVGGNLRTEEVRISVTPPSFPAVENMLPGQEQDYQLTVQNQGVRDMQIFTEISLQVKGEMGDELAWFIYDKSVQESPEVYRRSEHEAGEGGDPDAGSALKLLSAEYDAEWNTTTVKFLMVGDRLRGTGGLTAEELLDEELVAGTREEIAFTLKMAGNAGNEWQAAECWIEADVYAVQAEYNGLNENEYREQWEYIKSTAGQEEKIEVS